MFSPIFTELSIQFAQNDQPVNRHMPDNVFSHIHRVIHTICPEWPACQQTYARQCFLPYSQSYPYNLPRMTSLSTDICQTMFSPIFTVIHTICPEWPACQQTYARQCFLPYSQSYPYNLPRMTSLSPAGGWIQAATSYG